jgi:hypothetical protein
VIIPIMDKLYAFALPENAVGNGAAKGD